MGDKQFGRYKHKPKTKRYWMNNTRIRNKLKRVLQSSGWKEAKRYAKDNLVLGMLKDLKGR